jgi:putative transposase
MKKSRFTAEQIVAILQEVASGRPGRQVARKHGITETTLYRWKRMYGGMRPTEAKRLRQLEEENRRLKRLVAEQALDMVALKDVAGRRW